MKRLFISRIEESYAAAALDIYFNPNEATAPAAKNLFTLFIFYLYPLSIGYRSRVLMSK